MLKLNLSLGKRIALLACFFLIGFFISSVFSLVMMHVFPNEPTKALRLSTVVQDMFVFIIPAIATAVMVTRQPADLLDINSRMPLLPILFAVFVVVAATPAMNVMIWLNSHVPLPESVAGALQALEDKAAESVDAMLGVSTGGNFLVSFLIVAVLAGFSEELFFRGALQRLMITGGINPHAAIWTVGALFSLLHMQFYGFVPRMLLGVLFGYSFWWTRTLWVPVIMHIANNSLYLIFKWVGESDKSARDIDTLGVSGNPWTDAAVFLLSVLLVWGGLRLVYVFRNSPVKQSRQ